MNFKRIIAAGLSCMLIFSMTGCNSNTNKQETPSENIGNIDNRNSDNKVDNTGISTEEILTLNADDMFTDRDKRNEYDAASATRITLSGESITLPQEGCYIITGFLNDGQIVIDAPDTTKIQLVLDNVSINSNDNAPIFIKEADKVFITLADGTNNTLTNGGTFVENEYNIDAVIFSKADLTLNGTGTLTISSAGGHGIVSKDDLVITSGNYDITAASSAISGKDSVRIADGTFTLNSTKDGIHSENTDDTQKGFIYIADGTFDITAESDGLDATSTIQVEGGTFHLVTADDAMHADSYLWIRDGVINAAKCYEGLEAQNITVDGGTIDIIASDDGMNASGGNDGSGLGPGGGMDFPRGGNPPSEIPSGELPSGEFPSMGEIPNSEFPSKNEAPTGDFFTHEDRFSSSNTSGITINGGIITLKADGDGIDSNGSLTINGGEIYVEGSENGGNGALDYATSAIINGGIFVAMGQSAMAQNFGSDSTQCAMLVNTSSSLNANDIFTLTDATGASIVTYTPSIRYNSVLISTPDIKTGASYTLTAGTENVSIEMTDTIYGSGMGAVGGFEGMGNMGGPQNHDNPGNRPDDMGGKPSMNPNQ